MATNAPPYLSEAPLPRDRPGGELDVRDPEQRPDVTCYPPPDYCPPLGGRGGNNCDTQVREWHLFGDIANDPEAPTFILPNDEQVISPVTSHVPDIYTPDRERLWRISTSVLSAYRQPGPFSPATRGAVQSRTLANATFSMRGSVQIRVWLRGHAGGPHFDFDSGQTIEVWASEITVGPVGPQNFVEVIPGANIESSQNGIVTDIFLGLSITPIELARGYNRALLTQKVFGFDGAETAVEIPPFARTAQIFQEPTGNPSAFWQGTYGGNANTVRVNLPPFGTTRATERFEIGDYSHFRVDAQPGFRQYIIVYEVYP